ncbi:MAG: tyrosine-type recombinase/integrase [Azospirillum sp.]|nr:tyrosine-type recombinase/integrase [Azospirillum sp.]
MASVRQRTWRTKGGSSKCWQLSYTDAEGRRHRESFVRRAEANARRIQVESELARGAHVPDSASRTVLQAAEAWLDSIERLVRAGKRERSTWEQYRAHVRHHLAEAPIAALLLSRLRPVEVADFTDSLDRTLSPAMARKVLGSLRMALGFARRRQWLATDPAEGVRVAGGGRERVPIEIPTKLEIAALLKAADQAALADTADRERRPDRGFSAAFVRLLLFAGLRASEVRGLARSALVLAGGNAAVRVMQRADQYGVIGAPKSSSGRRSVPLGPETAQALRIWLLAAPPAGPHDLVFPSGTGTPLIYTHLWHRWWAPLLKGAGLTLADGEMPRFGLHMLRHVAASLWIEQGLQPKRIQRLMGHATLQMTMDTYGHLWSDADSDQAIAKAMERQI